MPNDAPHPNPLTDERWTQLMSPLRRYFPEDAEENRERDFRKQVTEIAAHFRDKETELDEWMARTSLLLPTVMQPVRAEEDELLLTLASNLPYIVIAREQEPPLPAVARDRIREVHRKAAALTDAISSFLADPWVGVVFQAEAMMAGAHWQSKQDASSETDLPPAALTQLSEKDALISMLDALETGPAFISPICAILETSRHRVETISGLASIGVQWLEGLQTRGRPPEAGSRLPALFIASIARQCAPAPPRGGGVRRWREVIAAFVCGVLAEAGLPSVNREYLEKTLK